MTRTLPQTDLAYPTCKALKDAGYPQGQTDRGIYPDGSMLHPDEWPSLYVDEGVVACPNSDELLAELDGMVEHGAGATTADHWKSVLDLAYNLCEADTPLAEALANLYIALAGVTP